ncbi:hypothetical protein COM24_07225 [Bacillus toyonensis]|uniref:hypothetical protein n=1 Tax=Bacillus cereus group TaxID=86661 RepID=UPI000BF6D91D|nr:MULTISPECIES: hypothetical protein [Bacillus cereus group]MCU5224018.1 hypothetical protein [Bacillus tropicus]MCU5503832.1 hypothetical protein [Bacillus cereus]PGC56594.1 hypothetical protein COM24_07225 [Bacillus toyonensis]PGV23037.1 hypothetical protein COD93_29670 [Bacillus cereus]
MEMISFYLSSSRYAQYMYVRKLWNQHKIKVTPDIAEFIENTCGFSRHTLKKLSTQLSTGEEEMSQDLEGVCALGLVWIIYLIDSQNFDKISAIFKQIDHSISAYSS